LKSRYREIPFFFLSFFPSILSECKVLPFTLIMTIEIMRAKPTNLKIYSKNVEEIVLILVAGTLTVL
jgi:hypothetical protein